MKQFPQDNSRWHIKDIYGNEYDAKDFKGTFKTGYTVTSESGVTRKYKRNDLLNIIPFNKK